MAMRQSANWKLSPFGWVGVVAEGGGWQVRRDRDLKSYRVVEWYRKREHAVALRDLLVRGVGELDAKQSIRSMPNPAPLRGTVNDIPSTWTPVMVRKVGKAVQIKMRRT